MAEIDHAAFAAAVAERLARRKLSFERAVAKWPDLNKAMLSRAVNEMPLSAGNFLLLCKVLRMSPYSFLILDKRRRLRLGDIAERLKNQAVTVDLPRETVGGARP
ncbi:hypothetical protein [Chelativorans oligotrophicus]|uniref:hypothetical protein n=1 Tax=Chelativorans oligotrophicus TaxID=449974 RepID=UPI00140C8B6C|nr:hypothetical protein [Chelativorans oligotrophicus]